MIFLEKIIKTALGEISGLETQSAYVYKGIPYAQPPINENRFRAPQPVKPWSGIYKADHFSFICPQTPEKEGSFYHKEFFSDSTFMPDTNEDCLYLNIWTPKEINKPCPVAIWIHGGGFLHGFGSEMEFDGDAYAKKGVILVTINYRLGFFGYFSHPELTKRDGRSGNYGLLDQMAAIEWVREHINSFGGDKDNITVFGQSAGGMSACALLCSPMMEGKIKQAILQSCGGYQSSLQTNLTMESLEKVCAGYLKKNKLTLDQFIHLPTDKLVEHSNKFFVYAMLHTRKLLCLAPVIDGYALPQKIDETIDAQKTLRIPTLIGSTKNDITVNKAGVKDRNKNKLYSSAIKWAVKHNEQGVPSYVYYFTRQMPGDDKGAFHSSELWYQFGTLDRCWRPLTNEDYSLSEQMIEAWTSFMKTGDPGWDKCDRETLFVKEF